MNVFISYGSVADQVTALRLAAVNGLTVYVPPAYTRQGLSAVLEPETRQKPNEADVILGVVGGAGWTEACTQELNAGIELRKNIIVMSDPVLAPRLQPHFGSNLVVINPADPDQAEIHMVRYLKSVNAEQNVKTALLALGTRFGLAHFRPCRSNVVPNAGAPLHHRQFLRHCLRSSRSSATAQPPIFSCARTQGRPGRSLQASSH
jgi:hypothetical protein